MADRGLIDAVTCAAGGAQQRIEAPAGGHQGAAAAAISACASEPRHVLAPAQAQPRAPLQPRAAPQPVALRVSPTTASPRRMAHAALSEA